MITQQNIARGYWLITLMLLATALMYRTEPYMFYTIAFCLFHGLYFWVQTRHFLAFPVQVRLAYIALLCMSLWSPLHFIAWLQLVGTTAAVFVDYCFLARVMSLMPWNKRERYSLRLFKRTFFTPPVSGSVMDSLVARGSSLS